MNLVDAVSLYPSIWADSLSKLKFFAAVLLALDPVELGTLEYASGLMRPFTEPKAVGTFDCVEVGDLSSFASATMSTLIVVRKCKANLEAAEEARASSPINSFWFNKELRFHCSALNVPSVSPAYPLLVALLKGAERELEGLTFQLRLTQVERPVGGRDFQDVEFARSHIDEIAQSLENIRVSYPSAHATLFSDPCWAGVVLATLTHAQWVFKAVSDAAEAMQITPLALKQLRLSSAVDDLIIQLKEAKRCAKDLDARSAH